MLSDQKKQKVEKIKEGTVSELKKFAVIALYLWALFSLFEIHRFAVLREAHLAAGVSPFRLGAAAVKALIMGKVILIGEALHVGERFGKDRVITATMFKSAMFAVLLVCFDVVEEVIVGMIHGKSMVASIPQFAGGGLEGKILEAVMAFVALLPFFLFVEMEDVIGKQKLHSLILKRKAEADAA